jgi:hypothetical protein
MKRILTITLLLAASHFVLGQQYNNEWINFNQTYYKFKVGANGLYRIPQSTLANGLAGAQVQNLKLWRNGQQVIFYSSVAAGTLGPSDYLEFWGRANDGKPDRPLYRDSLYQHTDKISLQTDTAVYFLTVSSTPNTLITELPNNVAANTLPVEPYFMYTHGTYYRQRMNPGLRPWLENMFTVPLMIR